MFGRSHLDVRSRWIEALRKEVPEIEAWWARLRHMEEPLARARWPAGPASHPRVITLFRKFYFEVEALNVAITQSESSPPAELWGSDDASDPFEAPVQPVELLLSSLVEDAPDLAEFMRKFDFLPIGETPDFEVC